MSQQKLRFDGWVLDPISGDLERNGVRTRLQEQPVLVLRELIANAGNVVAREHLIALLWPKGVVDFDVGINTAVRKLRNALGDDAETPRYIETLPRRGYRFIGLLENSSEVISPALDVAPSVTEPEIATQESPTKSNRLTARLAIAPILLALIAAVALWYFEGSRDGWSNPIANAKFTSLGEFAGDKQASAISRDGAKVAFLAEHDGRTDAWLTEIGTSRSIDLTQGKFPQLMNPSIRPLGFSSDGSFVAIWTRKGDGSHADDINLQSVSVDGGEPRLFLPQAAEVSWSSDGAKLVYHTTAPGDPLFVRAAKGSEARNIYTAPAGVHCHFPIWSHSDDFIYFVRGVPPKVWDIWRIKPSGSNLEQITFQNTLVSHPVLLDEKTLLYLATDADGSGPWIYAIDLRQRVSRRISSGLERYTTLDASADGKRLVATIAKEKSTLWSVALAPARSPATFATSVASASTTAASPRFGPGYLIYVSTRNGRQGIWKLANGKSSELWNDARATVVGAPAIAANGRQLAFTIADAKSTRLLLEDVDGSNLKVLADSLTLRGSPAWSGDEKSVITAVEVDGLPRLARLFLDGKPPEFGLVPEYSLDPAWSPKGEFLIYSGADFGTTFALKAIDPSGRPHTLPPLNLTRGARRVVFYPDGQSIVVLRGEIGHKNFWRIDLKTGVEQQLTELPRNFVIRDFDIAADGSQIVFDRQEESSEVALIELK